MKQTAHTCVRCGAVFVRGKQTPIGTLCPQCARDIKQMNLNFKDVKND